MEDTKKMTVHINGKDYYINHTEADEYIAKIGQFVNKKIQETSVDGMKLMEEKAIVMACINIADEYFKAKKQLQTALDDIDQLKQEKRDLELKLTRYQGGY